MKVLMFSTAAAAIVAALAGPAAAETQTVNGTLMDAMCASMHASDMKFTDDHDKKCLLMDACVKSGYTVITADHKVLKFDAKGNQLAGALIKKTNRDKQWMIAVTGNVSGDTIAVTNLKLR
jgi:hypothetical protein